MRRDEESRHERKNPLRYRWFHTGSYRLIKMWRDEESRHRTKKPLRYRWFHTGGSVFA
jgi:hypothetical protein